MATTTTNLGLRKPAKTNFVNVVTDINENMDVIDSSVNSAQKSVANMSDGNTHVAVVAGEYLYVRNHASLSEGLYQATTAIAQNGTLSSSNVTAITRGLGGQVTELNSKVSAIKSAGRVITSTSDGKASFTIPNASAAFVIIGGTAPIMIGMTSGGAIYNSTLPSGYTVSQSGNTVTVTKTSSVSTAVAVNYIIV